MIDSSYGWGNIPQTLLGLIRHNKANHWLSNWKWKWDSTSNRHDSWHDSFAYSVHEPLSIHELLSIHEPPRPNRYHYSTPHFQYGSHSLLDTSQQKTPLEYAKYYSGDGLISMIAVLCNHINSSILVEVNVNVENRVKRRRIESFPNWLVKQIWPRLKQDQTTIWWSFRSSLLSSWANRRLALLAQRARKKEALLQQSQNSEKSRRHFIFLKHWSSTIDPTWKFFAL